MPSAIGCDFSTHAVHFARVGKEVERQAVVPLDGKSFDEQVLAVSSELTDIGADASLVLVERVFVHGGAKQNFDASLRLAAIAAMVRTVASLRGFRTLEMLATEWRPIAGIPSARGGARYGRTDFKKLAIDLVKLEFDIDTRDDNAAEAILLGRVATILARREQLLAGASA